MFKNFLNKSILTVFVALLALAIPASASAAGGAIVFSKVTEDHRIYKEGETVLPAKAPEGGLFAVKDRHLNQLTENPADTEPSFSADGHTIAFVREGDVFAIRADGSGEKRLTSGAKMRRLTKTAGLDEYAPNVLNTTIVYSRGENSEGPSAYADVYKMGIDGKHAKKVIAGAGSAYVEDVTGNGRTILFRRDQGLWVKQLGGKGRKLSDLPDNAHVNSVFSSDGKQVATFTETPEGEQSLSVIDVGTGRRSYAEVVGYSSGEVTTTIGPIVAWQPVPPRR
jgi:dipeptidyl aminopeptidase/acylaminoacyl peptidase